MDELIKRILEEPIGFLSCVAAFVLFGWWIVHSIRANKKADLLLKKSKRKSMSNMKTILVGVFFLIARECCYVILSTMR